MLLLLMFNSYINSTLSSQRLPKRTILRQIYQQKSLNLQHLDKIRCIIFDVITGQSQTKQEEFNPQQQPLPKEQILRLVHLLINGSKKGHLFIDCRDAKIKQMIKTIFQKILTCGTQYGRELYEALQTTNSIKQIIERFFPHQLKQKITQIRQRNIESQKVQTIDKLPQYMTGLEKYDIDDKKLQSYRQYRQMQLNRNFSSKYSQL